MIDEKTAVRHLVTLWVACVLVFSYAHAYFVRGTWPASHPWSGLTMVWLGVMVSLVPPRGGASPARVRLALLVVVAASVCWLIDELVR